MEYREGAALYIFRKGGGEADPISPGTNIQSGESPFSSLVGNIMY
jgi:hypothetical protein